MKKLLFRFIVAIVFILAAVNSLSIYINGGQYRVRTILSPFHFQEKVMDGAQFSLQLTQMIAFRLEQKISQ